MKPCRCSVLVANLRVAEHAGLERAEVTGARRTLARDTLDRRTRMMYEQHHVFINGESYRAAGKDARLMRRLADEHCLNAQAVRRASVAARSLRREWFSAGWLHAARR